MSQQVNFKWPQGEDLEIALIYKEGESENSASAVNLSSGYEARMDIVLPGRPPVVRWSGESAEDDISLGTGVDKQANIVVWLPRSLLLPGTPGDPDADPVVLPGAPGVLFADLATTTNFNYDLFLRNTGTNKQVKVLSGQIQIERSNTLWL